MREQIRPESGEARPLFEEQETPAALRSDSNERTDEQHACILTAMRILAYGDNTEKRLREKLARKNYTPEAIGAAVDYCRGKGYLNSERQLRQAVETMAQNRLFGRRRIAMELFRKGFERRQIAEIDYDLLGIDFVKNCAALLCKQNHLYDETAARLFQPDEKTLARAVRYGYSVAEVREAVAMLKGS